MPLRRALLRVTLVFLAIAAVATIAAVLAGSTTVLWRIVLTCLEGAVATGVMLRLSGFFDKPEQRLAGVVGLAWMLASFALFLFCTWIDLFGLPYTGHLLGTAFAIAGFGGVATGALSARPRREWTAAWPAAVAVSGLGLAVTLAAIWTDNVRAAAACGTSVPVLLVGSLCLVGRDYRERPWRFVGVVLAIAAAAVGIVQAVQDRPNDELWRWYTALTAGLAAVTHANLLMLLALPGGWRWLRLATVLAAVATAVGVSDGAFLSTDQVWDLLDQTLGRATAAAGILAVCGTLALAARERLGKRWVVDATQTEFRSVTLFCPRCQTRQAAPVGDSPCVGCRLLLSVRVGEPRCAACGYSLIDLKSDRCPECGEPIPARGLAIPAREPTLTEPGAAATPL